MKKTLIEGSDYSVRLLDFPDSTIGGAVVEDAEGFNTVFINSRRSIEAQRESFRHELRHIVRDDFHNDLSIEEVEADTDESPVVSAALQYDTTAEYAQFVEDELGIRLNFAEDASVEEVAATVAWLEAMRNPWGMDE